MQATCVASPADRLDGYRATPYAALWKRRGQFDASTVGGLLYAAGLAAGTAAIRASDTEPSAGKDRHDHGSSCIIEQRTGPGSGSNVIIVSIRMKLLITRVILQATQIKMWGYTFMLLKAIPLELTLIHAAALSYTMCNKQ